MIRRSSSRLATSAAAAALGLAALGGCDPGPNRSEIEPAAEKLSRPDHPSVDDGSPKGLHVEPDRDPAPPVDATDVKTLEQAAPQP